MNRESVLPPKACTPVRGGILQRKCACGQHSGGGECEECKKKKLQRRRSQDAEPSEVPPIVHEVLRSSAQPLDARTRGFMEPRFGQDFSQVRVHADDRAALSSRAVGALAYTVGRDVVFGSGQYAPETPQGRELLAHELAHVVQQRSAPSLAAGAISISDSPLEEANADHLTDSALAGSPIGPVVSSAPGVQRREAPYIRKITVHLTPDQTADLEWEGTPPADALGSDSFKVSTGKGYGDPGDPPGTCTRSCCKDSLKQCAPPWNQPTKIGACCTYYGDNFWTGVPVNEHNGWKWWTPIQPHYSARGIALHQHTEVTGKPIGHGCVRMENDNAKRIHDFSNGRRTKVTINGRAAPVACEEDRKCPGASGSSGSGATGLLEAEEKPEGGQLASAEAEMETEAVPGLEGELT